ncbi:Mu transposase C-terminal domain-containing protein [Streptomyces acidiscabies]|uniref:Mu transposase C-terminal domain-containing protein n=1 Tax=Streptomyces acidiscabies TaxID=42234 RepID=UPI001F3BC316|nr:Mu transposase C-terminal domain-containing protein [Streptomyces acidiscabies]
MAISPVSIAALGKLTSSQRERAMSRFAALRPHLEDGVPLARAAAEAGVACRTAQRWAAAYRDRGLAGLVRARRSDAGHRRVPEELRHLVEGLALRRPAPHLTWVHRRVVEVAKDQGWPVPSYSTVYSIVRALDPALVVLAHEGAKRYREVYDLIHRREAEGPNAVWQADHTQLDLWVIAPSGRPVRPWLTVVEDDYSRAIAGYAVNLGAPSALNTALALRQAIWRKPDPAWHICGIPAVFYTDHGSDFTSAHMEQAAAELKIRLVFSLPGQPRGRGKIERIMDTVNTLCLSDLSGYAPRGTKDRAGQARLSLAELDHALGAFFVGTYNQREHGETGHPPQARWEAGAFLPHMPDALEQLDLFLLTVAKPRKIHPDGIHFQSLRYLDPVLAAYVGEDVTIRYDPRDLAEIRVFHQDRYLTRAICPQLAGTTVSLKDITTARNARRRELTGTLRQRTSVVDRLLAVHTTPEPPTREPPPAPEESRPKLRRYREE